MFKLFKQLGKKELLYAIICIFFVTIHVYFELKIPDYMSEITMLVQTPGSKFAEVIITGCFMLLCALLSLIATVVVCFLSAKIAASFGKIVRRNIFQKVNDFGLGEMKKFQVSSLITRTTNDVYQIKMLIAFGLQALVKAPIMATMAILKILGKNFYWSMATGISVVILLSIIITLMVIVFPRFKIVQKLTDNLNRITRENLTGIRVIRAFNAEDYQQSKFEEANEELKNTQLFNQKVMGLLSPSISIIMSFLGLAIYVIGSVLIERTAPLSKLSLFSDMVVFSSYAMQILMSFMMLIMIFIILPRSMVSAKRINEVLDTEVSIKDGNKIKGIEKGTVEFKNVSFKYPDAEDYILENISFKVEKGETVAFIGSTGSGKSTLINLIVRMYDVTSGEILVDGINIQDYQMDALYNIVGYIPQKPVIFSKTIKDNVKYGNSKKRNIKNKDIEKAIEIAEAKEFVLKQKDRYDALLARGGTNISGGQKQRIAIARAIVRDPEIYIFDDSFSALDYKTDKKLRNNLKKHTKEATNLIVAQRIGTIKNADKIIVLDEGKCVGMGNHQELLNNCQVYKEIALSQLSKEELEDV